MKNTVIRKALAGATILLALVANADGQLQPTPQQLQNQINAIPWSNNRNLVTGPAVESLFNYVVQLFEAASVPGASTTTIDPTLKQYAGGMNGASISYDDGVIATGSNTLCSNKANFPPTVVGQLFSMDYLGSGSDAIGAGGMPLTGTVTKWVSPNCVTVSTAATLSSGWSFTNWFVPEDTSTASYAIGQIVTVVGGTLFPGGSPASGRVIALQPIAATVQSAGSGGITSSGLTTGACLVQGTTGTTGTNNYRFLVQAELTSGAVTSIDAITFKGVYVGNMTDSTAEPVVPVQGCTGLTGAKLALIMTPEVISPINRGKYSVLPPAGSAVTVDSGTGVGLTMNLNATVTGTYVIGADSSPALTAAITASDTINGAGGRAVISIPAGFYVLSSPPPISLHSMCVNGAEKNKTWLQLLPQFSGDTFSWSEAWNAPNGVEYLNATGGLGPFSALNITPCIKSITITGDREGGNIQNGAMFYDRTDHAIVDSDYFVNLTGHCFAFGLEKFKTSAYVRDSVDIAFNECWNSGSTDTPAVLFDIQGTGAASEIDIDDLHIFGPFGPGLTITDDTTGSFRDIRMQHVRVEGIPHYPVVGLSGDLMTIGSPTNTEGQIFNVSCLDCEWTNSFLGYNSITITHNGKPLAPHNIHLTGDIIGGDNYGAGLNIVSGRGVNAQFGSINSQDVYVSISSLVGGGNQIRGVGGSEQGWIYSAPSFIAAAEPVSSGSGYLLGEQLTIGPGVNPGLSCATYPIFKVTNASPLTVSTLPPGTAGFCDTLGTSPLAVSSSSGSGTGATFAPLWGSAASAAAINNWNLQQYLSSVTTSNSGIGNAVGDLLTLGPVANSGMVCQELPILSVTGISPLTTSVAIPGLCTSPGSTVLAVSATTGSGSGEMFIPVWSSNP